MWISLNSTQCHLYLFTAGEFDLRVEITVDGDVQVFVTPHEGYLIPELTRLRIKFTSEEEERNGISSNTTSTPAFANTETIFYQIPSSAVPFQRFKVQVAQLVDGITGPFVPELESSQIFGEFLARIYYDYTIVGLMNSHFLARQHNRGFYMTYNF